VPMPKRPFIAAAESLRAFGKAWRSFGGCGCVKRAKDAARRLAGKPA
jgi:hypothetical protein